MSTEYGASGSTTIWLKPPLGYRRANASVDLGPGNTARHRAAELFHERRRDDADARIADARILPGRVPPQNDFLLQLRREKRRAERSKTPLSLVLYRMNGCGRDDLDRLLEILYAAKRETDIVGHVREDQVAIVCPDTDNAGAEAFLRKIEARAAELSIIGVTATYPDHLFDALTTSNEGLPELPASLLEDSPGSGKTEYLLKRWLDIVGSLLALVLLGPLMLVVAAVIALTSRGPIIYRQARLGKGGVPFHFYKFRSMVVNNDDKAHREFVANLIKAAEGSAAAQAGGEPLYKMKADPRISTVGRFIRKTSIDELPQLFNVLKGDMSLVGPRPPIMYETANYQAWHLRRLVSIKPGITGLWQVEGRSKVSFNDMVRMDLRYIRTCSLGTDLRIMLKTFVVVLRGDGAS